jgi:hypothetical protein
LEIAAADDGWEIKIAVGRIVDGIAEDTALLRREEDGAIHGAICRGGDREKNTFEICGAELAFVPDDISSRGEIRDFGFRLWCDNGKARASAQQGSDF